MARRLACAIVVMIAASPAGADPGRRVMVVQPADAFAPAAQESPFIYLNRCTGGCTVTGGNMNDASQQLSSIPPPGTYNLSAFSNYMGSLGANGNCVGGSNDTQPCMMDPQCQGDTCNTTA